MADRVLWLGTQVTDTPRSGGGIRSLRLLEAVAKHADVDLVTTESPSGGALPIASHTPAPLPSKPEKALNVARGWPRVTVRSCSRRGVATVRRLERGATWVVVEWPHLFPMAPRTGPYVLALHNAEADREAPARLVEEERRLAADPRATVVVVSERDRDVLGVPAVVVPNGTEVPAAPTEVPAEGDVLYVGAMDYTPNRLAVDWWVEEVWRPGLPPLAVAGRKADVLLPPSPALRILGEVPDVAPVLASAALVAVPLRHGGGTRLKVLEAFAANRPVLSTAKGVEGLDVAGACVVADGPRAFGDAVLALLADLPRRRALAAAGRAVAERHAWGPFAELFAETVLRSPRRA